MMLFGKKIVFILVAISETENKIKMKKITSKVVLDAMSSTVILISLIHIPEKEEEKKELRSRKIEVMGRVEVDQKNVSHLIAKMKTIKVLLKKKKRDQDQDKKNHKKLKRNFVSY